MSTYHTGLTKYEVLEALKGVVISFGKPAGVTLEQMVDDYHQRFNAKRFSSEVMKAGVDRVVETWTETRRPRPGDFIMAMFAARREMDGPPPERAVAYGAHTCAACHAHRWYAGCLSWVPERQVWSVVPALRCACPKFDTNPRWNHVEARAWLETDEEIKRQGFKPPVDWLPPLATEVYPVQATKRFTSPAFQGDGVALR